MSEEAKPLTAAEKNLRDCQRQLDMDGVEVGVSRQALDEVLATLAAERAKVEAAEARATAAECRRIAAAALSAGELAPPDKGEGSMEPTPWKGWAIYNRWGSCWQDTARRTRADAIEAFVKQWGDYYPVKTWRQFYREGYRALRITILAQKDPQL